MIATLDDEVADLRRANAELQQSLDDALARETATAEVLQVINSSPGDLSPVFDAMLDKAAKLCSAEAGVLFTYEYDHFRVAAWYGTLTPLRDFLTQEPLRPSPKTGLGSMARERRLIHITDVASRDSYKQSDPLSVASVELGGIRTFMAVPLLKDESLLGAFTLYRQQVRPFSEKQIALVQNFATQAVIAMENARLITETREALEQQTATAEVLQVINSSPGNLAPVFDAMLEKAMRLCGAAFGFMTVIDGEQSRTVAARGVPAAYAAFRERNPTPANAPISSRVRKGEPFIHTVDLKAERFYGAGDPQRRAIVDLGGARTLLAVPLMRDQAVLGAIQVYRTEVRPFTDKQIALLQNFAAQAVIAMENARLLTETREALEQQIATAEVLQVINSSPGELAPVFDATLEKAIRLCDSIQGTLWRFDGERIQLAASRGLSAELVEALRERRERHDPGERDPVRRIMRGERLVQILDAAADRSHGQVIAAAAEFGGVHTIIFVALRKDATPLGAFAISRREVQPFTDTQIALLENFAAQAVIAMENARLLTETREALEQQTATAEVLQVINSSPGDLTPVFDAMLEKATRLSDAAFGIMQVYDGERFRTVATRRMPPALTEFLLQTPRQPTPHSAVSRILDGEDFVQFEDMTTEQAYLSGDPRQQAFVKLGGTRTYVAVALRKDDRLLGTIGTYRHEVRPFTDKQIALLKNFAAQAVIAMENARLITETREALDQQTATAEVLQVINSSPGDLAPVFDAMLEKALRLCEAGLGTLLTWDGEYFNRVASRGLSTELIDPMGQRRKPTPGSVAERFVHGENIISISDLMEDDASRSSPALQAIARVGMRSYVSVALRKEAQLFGYIAIFRQEVQPFTDKQIALLQNFAAQAVIAMENARLITETREALEQQTATAEVLQVINSSPGNLQPVFDAMLDKALGLCGADFGVLWTYDGERIHATALRGVPPIFAEFLTRTSHSVAPDNAHGRLLRGEPVVHIADVAKDEAYRSGDPIRRTLVELGGGRTLLAVPLRKDDVFLGDFVIYRQEVRPFTDKQITLLQNFAAQAVIAIENARLLDEIRQRQAELRVTFDNMVDGVVMFDEELRLTAWNRNFQELLNLPDAVLAERPSYADYLRILADRGEFGTDNIEVELSRRLEDTDRELRLERTRPDGRVIEVRRNAVPDGGFVLIYSDITARKRSEAEIRAARDAAEAAYRDLKAAQANLIQAEKMASLGQLTAGIAHEIKNPLNFVNNFAGLSVELLDELKETAAPAITALDDDKRAEIHETIEMLTGNLGKIAEHGRRADNIVKSMLEHSRGSSGERRSVDLNGLIDEALNLAYHGARAQDQNFNVTLERDFADAIAPIELVPQDITRLCLNLFGNGFYATTKRQKDGRDPGFKPTMMVSTQDLGEAVEVRIRDNGIGISPEIKDKLFQPFFTTKPSGEGTGLGLSISYDIVTQQHGGTITVDSRVGEFTEFTVRLPRTYRARMAEAASRA
jgi:GAF domain-containing protein